MEETEKVKTIEDYGYGIPELPEIENADFYGYEYREEPLLEYVTKICDIIFYQPNELGNYQDEEGNLYPECISCGPNKFALRYCDGKIDESALQRYIDDQELQWILRAFRLDPAKFWYLILFIKDWAEDLTGKFSTTIATELQEIVKAIDQCKFNENRSFSNVSAEKNCNLIIDIEGKHNKIFSKIGTMYALRQIISKFLKKADFSIFLYYDLNSAYFINEDEAVDKSVFISEFTRILRFFLEDIKPDKNIKKFKYKIGNKQILYGISKDKLWLCSICISILLGKEEYHDIERQLLKNNIRAFNEKAQKYDHSHSIYLTY